ncbi:hypothetical protein Rsub_13303 [Raphidocelis subcapitata]|uniref:Uncharacterized protein n=1 Tax=Raphidocelis subcapitata TaxID=307507 RepID=A0A2V0PQL1_9CHLO|nr:hypothetical protein Rsub_13303 [Raphidocelis subcapitata]|eukprot:GBG00484.1 hypothetical protein Rsub_13303 [Raphidocelis subcapitata]
MSGGGGSTGQGSPRDPGAPATTGQVQQVRQQVTLLQQQLNRQQRQIDGLQGRLELSERRILAAVANRRDCQCPPDVGAQLARLQLGAQSAAAARSSSVGEQQD